MFDQKGRKLAKEGTLTDTERKSNCAGDQAACIMLEEKPKMVDDPSGKPGKKVAAYWDTAKRILNDPSAFLGSLLEYGRDNIPEAVIQKITPFMALEEFKPEHVAKV
jgi:dynein heavy chain